MRILLFDHHQDVTRSLLHQLIFLEHDIWIADHSICYQPKWKPEALEKTDYFYPYRIAGLKDLRTFDAFITLSNEVLQIIRKLAPNVKEIFFDTQKDSDLRDKKNVLTCIPKPGLHTYILTLPPIHDYHGPNINGNYVQLIFDFIKSSRGSLARIIYEHALKNYKGKKKIISYGDHNKVRDVDVFPEIYAQLHLKDWGSGNDFAILKGMSRGIPPIIYRPFIKNTVAENFLDPTTAFLFDKPDELTKILEDIENESEEVVLRGTEASIQVQDFVNNVSHIAKLDVFLHALR